MYTAELSSWRRLLLLLMIAVAAVNGQDSIRVANCQLVSQKYIGMGLPVEDVERMPLLGTHLKVCPTSGKTCCGANMEKKLAKKAGKDASKVFKYPSYSLRSSLRTKTAALLEFFRKLLAESYSQLNSMFSRTYGYQYQANKGIITNLFNQLKRYHPGQADRVKPILDNFFSKLFSKMFVLINREYQFTNDYLQCAEGKLDQLNPFGDKAKLLVQQLTRAFVTTRTFMQGLQVAQLVLNNMQDKVPMSAECTAALTRLRYCPLCAGQPDALPCATYCSNVLAGCFVQHQQLHAKWGKFIDTLSRTADTVSGPFNIKVIVEPLGYKISDAIMVFQNENTQFLTKVQKVCGTLMKKPMGSGYPRPGGRRKRAAQNSERRRGGRRGNRGSTGTNFGWTYDKSSRRNGGDLGRLVKETIAALKKAREMWVATPKSACSAGKVAASGQRCWNGTAVSSYNRPLSTSAANNPEISNGGFFRPHPAVTQSTLLLDKLTKNLEDAIKGKEVSYMQINTGEPATASVNPPARASFEGSGDGGRLPDPPVIEGSGDRPGPRPRPRPVTRRPVIPRVVTPRPRLRPDPDLDNEGSGEQPLLPGSTAGSTRAPEPTTTTTRVTTTAPRVRPPVRTNPPPPVVKVDPTTAAPRAPATTTTAPVKPVFPEGSGDGGDGGDDKDDGSRPTPPRPLPPIVEGSGDGDGDPGVVAPGPDEERPKPRPDPDTGYPRPRPGPDVDTENSGDGEGPLTGGNGGDGDLGGFPDTGGKDRGGIDSGGTSPGGSGTGSGKKLWLRPKDNNQKGGAEIIGEGSPHQPPSSRVSKKAECDPSSGLRCAAATATPRSVWLLTLLSVLLCGLLGALVAA